jgi:hypothetical protein
MRLLNDPQRGSTRWYHAITHAVVTFSEPAGTRIDADVARSRCRQLAKQPQVFSVLTHGAFVR